MEDERAHSVRIHAKLSKELSKFNQLSAYINEQKHIMSEDFEISQQLTLSKPLVTSMLEFLSIKSSSSKDNEELTSKIVLMQK